MQALTGVLAAVIDSGGVAISLGGLWLVCRLLRWLERRDLLQMQLEMERERRWWIDQLASQHGPAVLGVLPDLAGLVSGGEEHPGVRGTRRQPITSPD